jgi:Transposase DDE domain
MNSNPTPFLPGLRRIIGPMGRRTVETIRSLRQMTLVKVEDTLAPALAADRLAAPSSGLLSRERIFSLPRVFWCWIWQVLQFNTSCREVTAQVRTLFELHERKGPASDDDSSSYCQARQKLPLALIEAAFKDSVQTAEKISQPTQLLQARALHVVDASTFRLEDTPENRKEFPPPSNLPAGTGFPLLQCVALLSLASGAILSYATGSINVSEVKLLLTCLIGILQANDILITDRKYGYYVVLAKVKAQGSDMISRLADRTYKIDFRKAIKRLGYQDGLFEWTKPDRPSSMLSAEEWEALPPTLTVRILRYRIEQKGYRTRWITVVTTLLDVELYPKKEISQAYVRRWRMEMCLDDLKTTMCMEKLKCRTPAMVKKEMAIFLMTHNLLRWVMLQAAEMGNQTVERISFKGTIDQLRQRLIGMVQVRGRNAPRKRRRMWADMLLCIAGSPVPERPGRIEPRAVKKRSKYPHLNRPRRQYVDRWSRNKRRRVQRARNRSDLN